MIICQVSPECSSHTVLLFPSSNGKMIYCATRIVQLRDNHQGLLQRTRSQAQAANWMYSFPLALDSQRRNARSLIPQDVLSSDRPSSPNSSSCSAAVRMALSSAVNTPVPIAQATNVRSSCTLSSASPCILQLVRLSTWLLTFPRSMRALGTSELCSEVEATAPPAPC